MITQAFSVRTIPLYSVERHHRQLSRGASATRSVKVGLRYRLSFSQANAGQRGSLREKMTQDIRACHAGPRFPGRVTHGHDGMITSSANISATGCPVTRLGVSLQGLPNHMGRISRPGIRMVAIVGRGSQESPSRQNRSTTPLRTLHSLLHNLCSPPPNTMYGWAPPPNSEGYDPRYSPPYCGSMYEPSVSEESHAPRSTAKPTRTARRPPRPSRSASVCSQNGPTRSVPSNPSAVPAASGTSAFHTVPIPTPAAEVQEEPNSNHERSNSVFSESDLTRSANLQIDIARAVADTARNLRLSMSKTDN